VLTSELKLEKSGGVLTATLNRPEKKNAFTREMYAALAAAVVSADQDPMVRVLLVQGEGDSFTAGNDLSEFAAASADPSTAGVAADPLVKALAEATTPIVAAVHGQAVGIGLTMLLHCDLVYVAEDARISTPFAKLGICPGAASSMLLPARIGHARAFALFTLGDPIDGRTAAEWGLANAALPEAEVKPRARAAAEALASRPPGAVAATKRLLRDTAAYARQIEMESAEFMARLRSPEAKEAFAAFFERRAPDFSRF